MTADPGRALAALRRRLDRAANGAAAQLLPFYRHFPYDGPLGLVMIDRRGACSPAENFLYSRVPKAANSTVIAALADRSAYGRPGGRAKSRFLRPSRLGPRRARRLAREGFVFTFVRDPYARCLSAYRDKVLGEKVQAAKVRRGLGRVGGPPPGFLDFLDYLEAGGLFEDVHWAPQTDLFVVPFDRFDFVGRVERLEADLDALLGHLFGASGAAPPGRAGPRTDADGALPAILTPEAAARIERLYAADFALLGYPRLAAVRPSAG